MTPLDKLITYFEKFPGTGLRQAKRFAFHVLTLKPEQIKELSELITSLPNAVTECRSCHRFFSESAKLNQQIRESLKKEKVNKTFEDWLREALKSSRVKRLSTNEIK